MIYKDNKLTFDELLNRDNSVSIHHQNIQTLGIEMLKFVIGLSPEIIRRYFNSVKKAIINEDQEHRYPSSLFQ